MKQVNIPARQVVLAVLLIGSVGVAVRPAAANAPAGWYTIQNNGQPTGTVLDTRTELTWQQIVPTQSYAWTDALTYCSSNMAGLPGTGWRLPSIKELQTIIDFSVPTGGLLIDTNAFPGTPADSFWSSSPVATSPEYAWGVYFNSGGMYDDFLGAAYRVRCVR